MTTAGKGAGAEFIAVARIARPRGRHGEVIAEILTDFPDRLNRLRRVYLAEPGGPVELIEVEKAWPHQGRMIFKFVGIGSITEAERLRGREVLVPWAERAPLQGDQYYVSELEGCRVLVEQNGTTSELGRVTGLLPTGGVDLLRVETPGGEVLIPLAQAICRKIDTESKVIIVEPPDDLLELNRSS